jgi:hypothetical protein
MAGVQPAAAHTTSLIRYPAPIAPLLTARRRLVLGPVDEGLEQLELVRIRQCALPLALPGADDPLHHGLQLGTDAEPVLDDHRLR